MKNILSLIGLGMVLVTALALAGVAAWQSISGLADLFAAHKTVIIIMAVFIEWAKLLLAGAMHMFWKTLPWWRWIGIGIIGVHMAVTNIGIYSYISSGYLLQKQPVAALERDVSTLLPQLSAQRRIEEEASRAILAQDTAYQQYVENLFVKRAERYRARYAEERAALEAKRDAARVEIARLVGDDQSDALKVVAAFTILLMFGLDPAAILMVVLLSFLISKKIREDEAQVPVIVEEPEPEPEPLDDEAMKAAQHLKDIGYLDRRKAKKQ